MNARFINPHTDFGFKKLFGEEANKDLLMDFLNTLLPSRHQIRKLKFRNTELLGVIPTDRRSVFDIYCENEKKEQFIVEMQRAEQEFFKDRSVYYTTFPIQEQAPKDSYWNYELKCVYFIGILDFVMKGAARGEPIRRVSLKDNEGKEFYEKLQYIYVQMPLVTKPESELVTRQDKWLYFLRNLQSWDEIPSIFREKVFTKAFHTAEVSAMSPVDRARYQQHMKDTWTTVAVMETALKKTKEAEEQIKAADEMAKAADEMAKAAEEMAKAAEEMAKAAEDKAKATIEHAKAAEDKAKNRQKKAEEKIVKIAKKLKADGMSAVVISKMTGLSIPEIESFITFPTSEKSQ